MTPTTTTDLDAFVGILNNLGSRYSYGYKASKVNAKVWFMPLSSQGTPVEDQRSAYCFIRLADGAILLPASWNAPAKGVRAWLADVLADPSQVKATTGWLYRSI